MSEATQAAVLKEDVVVTILESVPYPDAVAEVADFLLRLQGASWSCCLAPYDQFRYISVRSKNPEAHAGQVLVSLLPRGKAGGHDMMAGGVFKKSGKWRAEASELAANFLKAVGKTGSKVEPLV